MGFVIKVLVHGRYQKTKTLIYQLTQLTETIVSKITDLYVNSKTMFIQVKLVQQQNAVISQGPV